MAAADPTIPNAVLYPSEAAALKGLLLQYLKHPFVQIVIVFLIGVCLGVFYVFSNVHSLRESRVGQTAEIRSLDAQMAAHATEMGAIRASVAALAATSAETVGGISGRLDGVAGQLKTMQGDQRTLRVELGKLKQRQDAVEGIVAGKR